MDDARFDDLTRALATPRRAALRLVAGSALGLALGWRTTDDAAAHNALAKCKKIKDKKKRKKCIKKAKAHNAAHAAEPQPECTTHQDCDDGLFCNGEETCGEDGICQPGTPPQCDDGIACTVDTCDEGSKTCLHTANSSLCPSDQACIPEQEGCRCTVGTTCGNQCCVAQSPTTCGTKGQCVGESTCAFYGSETVCHPATCEGPTVRRSQRFCNGSGSCSPGTPQDCSPHICDAGVCRNPCGSDFHCIGSHYCAVNGQCTQKQALGSSCSRDGQCGSNICQDGFCCATPCSGGFSCSETGTCACDPFVRCGTACSCVEGQCHLQTGICL